MNYWELTETFPLAIVRAAVSPVVSSETPSLATRDVIMAQLATADELTKYPLAGFESATVPTTYYSDWRLIFYPIDNNDKDDTSHPPATVIITSLNIGSL